MKHDPRYIGKSIMDSTAHELLNLKAKLHRVERELEAALKREREQRTLAEALSI